MADSPKIDTQCPVCKETFSLKDHYPKLLPCNHTVCKLCIQELGSDFDCPVCRFHIESTDLIAISTNFMAIGAVENEELLSSDTEDCENGNCDAEKTPTAEACPLQATLEEDLEDRLESEFRAALGETSERIEKYQQVIDGLKTSKDESLAQIDSEFERLEHLLSRRKQLLKNQVLTQYEEKLESIEENMEKVTFTTMCLTSLQKHSEVIFNEYCNTKAKLEEKELDTQGQQSQEEEISSRLVGNCRKISQEITELQEKLEDMDSIKEMGFNYENIGELDASKCIRSVGRVKLKLQ